MFWDKKEDKKSLPDLPPLQAPSGDSGFGVGRGSGLGDGPEMHDLPSFPDNMNEKGFSQSAIKGAVSGSSDSIRDDTLPGFPAPSAGDDGYKTVEMEEWKPESSAGDVGMEESTVPEFHHEEDNVQRAHETKRDFSADDKNKDIFVKLDKFYAARKSLVSVQDNLEDIDILLKKIRETKLREEQELQGWEKELEHVKARLNDVTVNLFEKVD